MFDDLRIWYDLTMDLMIDDGVGEIPRRSRQ